MSLPVAGWRRIHDDRRHRPSDRLGHLLNRWDVQDPVPLRPQVLLVLVPVDQRGDDPALAVAFTGLHGPVYHDRGIAAAGENRPVLPVGRCARHGDPDRLAVAGGDAHDRSVNGPGLLSISSSQLAKLPADGTRY